MSKYRQMRVLVLYDLSFESPKRVREYELFRKKLKRMGFIMLQYSIYSKVILNQAGYNKVVRNINDALPRYGNVRILKITEKQYSSMTLLLGTTSLQEDLISDNEIIVFREKSD